VEDFQERLKTAIQSQQSGGAATSPGELAAESATPLAEVAKNSVSMLRHDQGNVNMESQASEMAQNHIQHNLALSLLIDQFHLLQSAISEKV
jgi:flagellar basal-body rod protein FlgB